MAATTAQHIAARDDNDLFQRLVAAAEQAGVSEALAIQQSLGRIISQPITIGGEESTITEVHAYAAGVRQELLEDDRLLPPGQNPGAVTDVHLFAALKAAGIIPDPESEPTE